MKPPSDPTVAYYDANATRFAEDTRGVDMGSLYGPFLALVPAGGRILDAGCGAGRDALAFKQRGYRVLALDASAEMVRLTAQYAGVEARQARFEEVEFDTEFDGVWACASLLHVPRATLRVVLARLRRALRPGGVIYASFKLGEAEEVRGGRLYNDLTEETLARAVAPVPLLSLTRTWRTGDRRPGREAETWLNALLRRLAVPPV